MLMIDPMASRAFSVHAGRGIVVLLPGSGLSRAAGIPTGGEIVLELSRKPAAVKTVQKSYGPLKFRAGKIDTCRGRRRSWPRLS